METIVLLHCSGSSGAQWRALASRLDGRYRVIAPDLIGYGAAAGWSGRGRFSLACEAAAVRSLIGRVREPVHLVGHSYGGAVALHLARTRPDLLKSLALLEPSAFHLLRNGDATDAAALREITAVAADARAALAVGDTAALEDVCDIALRTLLVQGGCTELPSRCVCARLRTALPEATFRVVQGAGHMLPITHRDQVNALIESHLDANSTGAFHARPARAREPAALTP
jgi:pimeloyl-ACP methyl ester carboxylesterase